MTDENGKKLKVRWYVGWVESGQNCFPFAYLLQEYEIDALQTVPRVKQLLEESNLWNLREGKMQKELITMPEIKLVGICVRTSNEQELDKMKGNIFHCIQKYFHQGLAEKIQIVKDQAQHFVHTQTTKQITMENIPILLVKKFLLLMIYCLKDFNS